MEQHQIGHVHEYYLQGVAGQCPLQRTRSDGKPLDLLNQQGQLRPP